MTALTELIEIDGRFSKSSNVERDAGVAALVGYLPTGRALDVIRRVALGLADPSVGRAFSLTGPHGGGKSSMAVYLRALTSSRKSRHFSYAYETLSGVDKETATLLDQALRSVDSPGKGFQHLLVTARNEPVGDSLRRGLESLESPSRSSATKTRGKSKKSSANIDVLDRIRNAAKDRPLLIVIDEFGKSLEHYVDADSSGDPYLLQELAELTQGEHALPIILVTLQHMSFDDYLQSSSTPKRREWAKVQGRFQDIPYVETAQQSRRLIAATMRVTSKPLQSAVNSWVKKNAQSMQALGLQEVLGDTADCYPLHPVSLAVLPELCTKFGQNERTLFSFLSSTEPQAVPKFLSENEWSPKAQLPLVHVNQVYDYFVESAATSLGAATGASRWLEIESQIRDSVGLSDLETRTLKTVGLLNLISSSGLLRASRELIERSVAHEECSGSTCELEQCLSQLQEKGILTYREFSDEYRIWKGSDYDLHSAIHLAKAEFTKESTAALLRLSAEKSPIVAGRVSQESGVLRVFGQTFAGSEELESQAMCEEHLDGQIVYLTDTDLPDQLTSIKVDRPLLVTTLASDQHLRDHALEVLAIERVLGQADENSVDWVAKRELAERLSVAQQQLRVTLGAAWPLLKAGWHRCVPSRHKKAARITTVKNISTLSGIASDAAEATYTECPRIANEMLARRELTSQGAKARRLLIEALLAHPHEENFGITGYGPERAMYEAVFANTGLHRKHGKKFQTVQPSDPAWNSVWQLINESLSAASVDRESLASIYNRLKTPPVGLKEGILPVLAIAALQARDEDIALYEHGSLVLKLDDAVAERLAKNPDNFSVKNCGTSSGIRSEVVEKLATKLGITQEGATPSFLQVVRAIFKWLQDRPKFVHQTKQALSAPAIGVRDEIFNAVQPDDMLFVALPKVFGMEPFESSTRKNARRSEEFVNELFGALEELGGSYEQMLNNATQDLREVTRTPSGSLNELRAKLRGQGTNLADGILDADLRAFVGTLSRSTGSDQEWLENLLMVVAEGSPPRNWGDQDVLKFKRNVSDLGGRLRRTRALLFENTASDAEAFASRRVTITTPEGTETSEVVSVTERELADLDAALAQAHRGLAEIYGSDEAATRAMLAWSAIRDKVIEAPQVPSTDERGAQHG